ncbi:MAG: helix-turn-helix transcriptional regulator [Thiotrichales bacterium]
MASPEIIYRMSRRGDVPGLPELTGMGKSTIYLAIQQGKFPKGIKLGARSRGWPESQIKQWQDAQALGA